MKKILLLCIFIFFGFVASAQNTWQCEFSTLESNEVYKDRYAPVKAPIAISQNGFIYQTGRYDEPCMIGDSFLDNIATSAFIAALDAKGNHLWATGLRGAARITAATTDQNDNLYITGLFADDVVLGSTDYVEQTIVGCPDTHEMASAFIAKYDNNGILKAIKTISIGKNENGALANVGDAYTFDGSFTPNAIAICEDRVYVSAKYAGTYKIDEISQNSSFIYSMGVFIDATALCVLSFEQEALSDTKQELDMNNTKMENALENGPQSIAMASDGQEVYIALICTGNTTLTLGDKQEEFNPGTNAFTSIFTRLTGAKIQAIGTEKGERYWCVNEVNAMSVIDGKIYMAGTYSSPLSFAKNEQPDLWCDQWISCFDANSYEQQWCYSTDAKKDNMPNNDARYRYTTMATYTPNGEWKSIGTTNLTIDPNKHFTVDDTQTHLAIACTENLVATTDLSDNGCKLTIQVKDSNTIYAQSCTINKKTLELKVGESSKLLATILPENTTNKNINWTSSDNTIATVSNGTIKGLKAGTATITATTTDGTNLKATCSVTVKSKYATSITLNETSKSLTLGSTLQLEATVLPSDLENKTVTWKTSDATIASVSNGLVTAKKIGNATITATTTDGTNLSATSKITVTPIYVSSITLNHTSASLQLGESISLTASVLPQNATNKDVVWSSSDGNVATVNNGYVMTKKIGRATITAETTDGSNQKATCTITVNAKLVSSISLNKTTAELITGESLTLVATLKPDDATYRDVEWSSSNGSVASVSNGKVTALAPGNTVITVKTIDGSNLSATCDVKVLPIYVTSISLEKESLELLVDETALLTASVYPDNASEKTVVWTSSDVSVVSIDEGFVKAEGAGVATITVKTADGTNLSASCKVKVDRHPQTIIWNQDLSSLEQWGEFMELTASASSGLPLTYQSSNENVASILPLGTDLFYLNPGETGMAEVTASQPGNDYYAPVEMMKIAIVIDPNSIANIPANQGKYTVYTMTGGKVGTYSKEEYKELIKKHKLPNGVYIINGIKVGIK